MWHIPSLLYGLANPSIRLLFSGNAPWYIALSHPLSPNDTRTLSLSLPMHMLKWATVGRNVWAHALATVRSISIQAQYTGRRREGNSLGHPVYCMSVCYNECETDKKLRENFGEAGKRRSGRWNRNPKLDISLFLIRLQSAEKESRLFF